MRSATANASVTAAQLERAAASMESRPRLQSGKEEVLLKLDLSDLVLPRINDLHVDGLKRSWLSRLFGRN